MRARRMSKTDRKKKNENENSDPGRVSRQARLEFGVGGVVVVDSEVLPRRSWGRSNVTPLAPSSTSLALVLPYPVVPDATRVIEPEGGGGREGAEAGGGPGGVGSRPLFPLFALFADPEDAGRCV